MTPDNIIPFIPSPDMPPPIPSQETGAMAPPPLPSSINLEGTSHETISSAEALTQMNNPPITRTFSDALLECHHAAISAVPVDSYAGTARLPFMIGQSTIGTSADYAQYRGRCPTIQEVNQWCTTQNWPSRIGVGVVTGRVSGNLMAIRCYVPDPDLMTTLRAAVKRLLSPEISELLVVERMGNEGFVAFYRASRTVTLKTRALARHGGIPIYQILAEGELVKIAPCYGASQARRSIGLVATLSIEQEEKFMDALKQSSIEVGCHWLDN